MLDGSCLAEHLLDVALDQLRCMQLAAFTASAEAEFFRFSHRVKMTQGRRKSPRKFFQLDGTASLSSHPWMRGDSEPAGLAPEPARRSDAAYVRDAGSRDRDAMQTVLKNDIRPSRSSSHVVPPSYINGDGKMFDSTMNASAGNAPRGNGNIRTTSRNIKRNTDGCKPSSGSCKKLEEFRRDSSVRRIVPPHSIPRGDSLRVLRSGESPTFVRPTGRHSPTSERSLSTSLRTPHSNSMHTRLSFSPWSSNHLRPAALDRDPLHTSSSPTPMRDSYRFHRASSSLNRSHLSSQSYKLHDVDSNGGLTSVTTDQGPNGHGRLLSQRSALRTSPLPRFPSPADVKAHRSTLTGVFDWPIQTKVSFARKPQTLSSKQLPTAVDMDMVEQELVDDDRKHNPSLWNYISSHLSCELNSALECIGKKTSSELHRSGDDQLIQRGDILLECEGQPLTSVCMLRSCVEKYLREEKKILTFLVLRGSESIMVQELLVE